MNQRTAVCLFSCLFALAAFSTPGLAKKKKKKTGKVEAVVLQSTVKSGLIEMAGREKRDFVPFERSATGKVKLKGSAAKSGKCRFGKECKGKTKDVQISAKDYYDKLDELEGGLNEQGLSLSDEGEQSLGGVSYDSEKFAANEKTAANFQGKETTPPKEAKKEIHHRIEPPAPLNYGEEGNMKVRLVAWLDFKASGDEIAMEAGAGIMAWIYNKERTLLGLEAKIWGNQSRKNASTNLDISARVLGAKISLIVSTCPKSGKSTHKGIIVDAIKKKGGKPPRCENGQIVLAKIDQVFVSTSIVVWTQIQAGPIAIGVAVGIQFEIGIRFSATVGALVIRAELEPYAKCDAFVMVGVGTAFISIGVMVELTVLDLSFPIGLQIGLQVDDKGPYVYLMWGADWRIEVLSGKIKLGINVALPGRKAKNFGFTLANWPGITQRGSIFNSKQLKLYLLGKANPNWPKGKVPKNDIKAGKKGNVKTDGFTGDPWKRRANGCLLADGKYMFADSDRKTLSTTKNCNKAEKFEIQTLGLIGKSAHLTNGRKVRIKTYRRRWLKPNKKGDVVKQANLALPTHDTTFTMIVHKKVPLNKDVKVGFKCWGNSGYLAPSGSGFRCQKKKKWFKATKFKKGKLATEPKILTDCVPKQIHCGGPWSTRTKKSYNKCLKPLEKHKVCKDFVNDAKKCAKKCKDKIAGVACRLKCNFAKPINCKAKKFECGAPHNTVTKKSYKRCLNRLKGIKPCQSYVKKAQKCANKCPKGITGPKCRLDCNYGKKKNSCNAEQFDCGAPHNTLTAGGYTRCLNKHKNVPACKSYVSAAKKCAKNCSGPLGPFCRLDCNFGKDKKKKKAPTNCNLKKANCGAPHNTITAKKYKKCLNKLLGIKVCKSYAEKAKNCAKACKGSSGPFCRLDCNLGKAPKKKKKKKKEPTSCKTTQPADCGAPQNNTSTKKYKKCLDKYKKVKVCKSWVERARKCVKSCKKGLSGGFCRLDCNFGKKKKANKKPAKKKCGWYGTAPFCKGKCPKGWKKKKSSKKGDGKPCATGKKFYCCP
jgi:hypothetical protein